MKSKDEQSTSAKLSSNHRLNTRYRHFREEVQSVADTYDMSAQQLASIIQDDYVRKLRQWREFSEFMDYIIEGKITL